MIYIVIHRQICFVLSELISVARQYLPVAGIETRLIQTPSQSFSPLNHEEILATKYILNGYESQLLLFTYIRSTAAEISIKIRRDLQRR